MKCLVKQENIKCKMFNQLLLPFICTNYIKLFFIHFPLTSTLRPEIAGIEHPEVEYHLFEGECISMGFPSEVTCLHCVEVISWVAPDIWNSVQIESASITKCVHVML